MVGTKSSSCLASEAVADTAPSESEDSSESCHRVLEQLGHKATKPKRGASSASKTLAPTSQTSAEIELPTFSGYQNSAMPNISQIIPNQNACIQSPGIVQSPRKTMSPHPHDLHKSQVNNYPTHPNVKFKRLPFYSTLLEVIGPSTLPNLHLDNEMQDFKFHLTPLMIEIFKNDPHIIEFQLRFCLLTTSPEQEDNFPPKLTIKVNGVSCLPVQNEKLAISKQPPEPINITLMVNMSLNYTNVVSLSWEHIFGQQYIFYLSMVKKLTPTHLLNHLKQTSSNSPYFVQSLATKKFREDLDCEITTTHIYVSLVCPLGQKRMIYPCRSLTCKHIKCFDALAFLRLNEAKPSWLCPICQGPASYESLVLDGYFQNVLNSSRLNKDCTEIQIHKNGSWSVNVKKIKIINDDVETPGLKRSAAAAFTSSHTDVVNLISDDSDDDPQIDIKTSKDYTFMSVDSTTALDSNEFREKTRGESFDDRNHSNSVIILDSPSPSGNRDSPFSETNDSSSIPENSQSSKEVLDSPSPPANVHSPPKTVNSPSPTESLKSSISTASFSPEPSAFIELVQEALDSSITEHSLKGFNKTTNRPSANSDPSNSHVNPFEEPCGFVFAESSEESDPDE